MRIHTLRPAEGAVTPAKRLGRGTGSGLGKTSGKGHKGQWARSGGGVRPGFEGGTMPLTRRLPKRGFYNKFQKTYAVVNLSVFERFEDNAVVTPELLLDMGLVNNKSNAGLKVLGGGQLSKPLTVHVTNFRFPQRKQSKKRAVKQR